MIHVKILIIKNEDLSENKTETHDVVDGTVDEDWAIVETDPVKDFHTRVPDMARKVRKLNLEKKDRSGLQKGGGGTSSKLQQPCEGIYLSVSNLSIYHVCFSTSSNWIHSKNKL